MTRTVDEIMRNRRARVGGFYCMENVEADVVAGYRHPQDMVPDNPYETVHHPNDGYDGNGDFIPTAAQSRHSTPPPLYSPRVLSQPPPAYSGPPPARDVPRDVPRDIAQADFEVLPPGEGAAEYFAVPPAVDGRSASRLSIVDSIFDADDQVARRARAVLNMPQSDDNHDRSETTGQLARRHRMGFGKRVCRVFASAAKAPSRAKKVLCKTGKRGRAGE
jgi:hypothetical protein